VIAKFMAVVLGAAAVVLGVSLLSSGASASSADIAVSPASQNVSTSSLLTLTVSQNATIDTSGIQVDLSFDPLVLHITDLVTASSYSSASLLAGLAPQTTQQAMAEANQTGILPNLAAFFTGSTTVPAGITDAIQITLRACKPGTSTVSLAGYTMLDSIGNPLDQINVSSGSVGVSGSGPDADGDGMTDSCDNCPTWPNPAQALPSWPVSADDSDCDGFSGSDEIYFGTIAATQCPSTTVANDENPDAWPPDLNDDKLVNGQDSLKFNPHINHAVPPDSPRFDLNKDHFIDVSDVLVLSPFFSRVCTP
jgi:hypothetical protein